MKSLTRRNEEQQLRLGLGQVLRYQHLLQQRGRQAVAVLAVERQPTDAGWEDLCQRLGVVLMWPDVMASRLERTTGGSFPAAVTGR